MGPVGRVGQQRGCVPFVSPISTTRRRISVIASPTFVQLCDAGIGNEYQKYMYNGLPESIAKHPTSDWMRVIAVNQHGVYFGIREGAGSMLKNTAKEAKSIINFSSTAGLMGGTPFACLFFRAGWKAHFDEFPTFWKIPRQNGRFVV